MKNLVAPEAAGMTAVTLTAFHFLRIVKSRGCRIVCKSGILLVTVSGEYRDYELHPAGTLLVPNNGLVLVEAVGDSRLLLDGPWRGFLQLVPMPFRQISLPLRHGSRSTV